jgi:(1->4)-alpha-D-glucan 1-alpha-D-glucosylmutase
MMIAQRGRARNSYRLQVTRDFPLSAVAEQIDYLAALGVNCLYLSPQMTADPDHGYHVLDSNRVCPLRGGLRSLEEVSRKAHAAGMTITLDIVPNHMAPDDSNPYWRDLTWRRQVFDLHFGDGPESIRRFLTHSHIAGVRVEKPVVAQELFRLVRDLVRRRVVDRLRLDYIEGLARPIEFIDWLRDYTGLGPGDIDVEVMIEPEHPLFDPLRHAGTVGYDCFLGPAFHLFGNEAAGPVLNRIYASIHSRRRRDGESGRRLEAMYHELNGKHGSAGEKSWRLKRYHAEATYGPEIGFLCRYQPQLEWRQIVESLCALPRRTYVNPETGLVSSQDRALIETIRDAGGLDSEVAHILLNPSDDEQVIRFVALFQQMTNHIAATAGGHACWEHGRAVPAMEYGIDSDSQRLSVNDYHEKQLKWIKAFPGRRLAIQTHDTIRSPDARACWLAAMQDPGGYDAAMSAFFAANFAIRTELDIDVHDEYRIYQELICCGLAAVHELVEGDPNNHTRFDRHIIKSLREAEVNTNYQYPNAEYEGAVLTFIRRLVANSAFLNVFDPYRRELRQKARPIVQGQVVLQYATVGTPETYQGDEFTCFHLADPDQRGPVDYYQRRRSLRRFQGGALPESHEEKQHIIWLLSQWRNQYSEVFAEGPYSPVYDYGPDCCAYTLGACEEFLVVVPLNPSVSKPPAPAGYRDVLECVTPGFYVRETLSL